MMLRNEFKRYLSLDFIIVPLKYRSKKPLVHWGNGWNPTLEELEKWFANSRINVGLRCGQNLAVIDCDSEEAFENFITTYQLPPNCPIVKTSRGYHIWIKPKKAIHSRRVGNVEIKCLGSYVVAPPSIHPSGVQYIFQVPPNGEIPEVDLEALFNLPDNYNGLSDKGQADLKIPSDFALRYRKSTYPQSLCGLATKVLTRSDGEMKHLLSLRCWKWHCPKCAPLLKSHWLNKLSGLPFRFILWMPTADKPTTLLRHLGKPNYVHIIANDGSWLFLMQGDTEKVRSQARKLGYELVAGDYAGDPTPQQLINYLKQALCRQRKPLNIRRKISHSRRLFRRVCREDKSNESKQTTDRTVEDEHMSKDEDKRPRDWRTEVFMKPIEQVAKQLESEGWHIFWKSEVEAIAIRDKTIATGGLDIVALIKNLGVKLKKVGKEYAGLCPFHDDHTPSLRVNQEKGLWHCFGCGRCGGYHAFLKEWQKLRDSKNSTNL